jgi:rubredoxin
MNFATLTSAELVEFYNARAAELGAAPVKRFSDRKTAEARCAKIAAERWAREAAPAPAPVVVEPAPAAPAYVAGTCPKCGATTDITCGRVVEHGGRQHVVNEHEALCHGCGHEFNYDTGRPLRKARAPGARAESIAASWKDPAVAAARITRTSVRVTDPRGGSGNYKSVREAFLVLALPLGQHIRFRMALKAAGAAEIQGHRFQVVEAA